jgi:NADH pyrophosphatase NudC (nudix superfamily)
MALHREAREELGLTEIDGAERLLNYIWESPVEREMIYVHSIVLDEEPKPDQSEVVDGRFWKVEEIEENLGKDVFTPNFELDFQKLKECGKVK